MSDIEVLKKNLFICHWHLYKYFNDYTVSNYRDVHRKLIFVYIMLFRKKIMHVVTYNK